MCNLRIGTCAVVSVAFYNAVEFPRRLIQPAECRYLTGGDVSIIPPALEMPKLEKMRICRMIGVMLFRWLALPRRGGPSLAANSASGQLGSSRQLRGRILSATPPSFPLKLASLVAACCCSATLCVLRSLTRYKAEPRRPARSAA